MKTFETLEKLKLKQKGLFGHLPIEIRSRDLDDTLVILFHLEERTVLAPCVSELFNKQTKLQEEREREIEYRHPNKERVKERDLVIGLDETAAKTSPKLMAEAGRNLSRCASHYFLCFFRSIPLFQIPTLLLGRR